MVDVISLSEWKSSYMKNMYLESFNGERPSHLETCDHVMISFQDQDPEAFITCHEMDSETVYWQFGGVIGDVKKSIKVINHYIKFINFAQRKYKRITTRIENTNIAMLRLALKCGFLIVGTYSFKNKIYLELNLEFGG